MTIKYYYDLEQGTEEWHALRCGLLTASEAKLIITPSTLKYARNDKLKTHVYEIAAQRITRYTEPSYISDDMLRGWQDELEAKLIYSGKYAEVKDCGFVTNDAFDCVLGYSPDGLVGEDGQIEIKSRLQKYQIETINTNQIPKEHIIQVQMSLLISGRKWCDYISYSAGLHMIVIRAYPDEEIQNAIKEAVYCFESDVSEQVELYKKSLKENIKNLTPTERKIEEEMEI